MLDPLDRYMVGILARKRDSIQSREDRPRGSRSEAVGRRTAGRVGHELLVPAHAIRGSWTDQLSELVDWMRRTSELDGGTVVLDAAEEG